MSDQPMSMHAASPSSEWLAAGTELGRHRIVGKLSEGAHAIVYMGEHVQTRAEVAIKVLRRSYAANAEMVARFDREAVVMGRLAASRTVVHVHDVGALTDGRRYLVMEFVRGRELSTMLANVVRRGIPLELDRVVAIASDIAAALRDAHHKHVVHRDLKPSNVMIVREPDGRETAKLVDFGVSGDRDQLASGGDLTMTGSVIGTPEYMAPEQAVGLPASPSMDLFALGVVLFEMTTGALPPRTALRGGTVPPVSTLRPGVPAELDALIRDLLALDPKARPEDAIAVLTRLATVGARVRATSGPNAWAEGRPVRAAGAIELASNAASNAAWNGGAMAVAEVVPLRPQLDIAAATEPAEASAAAPIRTSESRLAVVAALCVVLAMGTGVVVWLLGEHVAGAPGDADLATSPVADLASRVADGTDHPHADELDASPIPAAVQVTSEAPAREPERAAPAAPAEPAAPVATDSLPERAQAEKSRLAEAPRKPTSRVSKPASGTPAAAVPADCDGERGQAQQASAALRWGAVLEHTRTAACWTDARARLRLRVEALAELGQFERCVREGGASSDGAVGQIVALCKKRIDAG